MTDSKVKANTVVQVLHDAAARTLTFKVKGAGEAVLQLHMLSAAVVERATLHGIKQRVSDAAAQLRDPTTGLSAPPEAKLASMARLVDHYNTGSDEWSPARAEGGPGLDPIIIQAIMEVLGKGDADVRALIEAGATKHAVSQKVYLAKLATGGAVAPIVARMRAAATPDIDADGDLASMMG